MSCSEESMLKRYPPVEELRRMGRTAKTRRNSANGSPLSSPSKENEGFGTPCGTPHSLPSEGRSPTSKLQFDSTDDSSQSEFWRQTPKSPLVQRKHSRVDDEAQSSSAVCSGAERRVSKISGSRNSLTVDQSPRQKMSCLSWACLFVFVVILVAVALGCYFFCMNQQGPSTLDRSFDGTIEEEFFEELVKIRDQFPNQSENVWTTAMSAVSSIMQEDPEQPGVLLLVGPNTSESEKTISYLAQRLAIAVNNIYSKSIDVVVSFTDKLKQGPEKVKEVVDVRMRAILKKSRAAVLSNIQDLPPSSALLLHGFCDNFMAPFKDRVIILTILFDRVALEEKREWRLQERVDYLLRRLWDPELGADKSSSLVSRVANYPVMIAPEPKLDTRF